MKSRRLPDRNKSTFDSATFIDDAISRCEELPALVADNGNLVVMVDFGHEVGFDEKRGRRTSVATVIVDQSGELITVYPGLPATGKDSDRLRRRGR